jgi:hypothetical protein
MNAKTTTVQNPFKVANVQDVIPPMFNYIMKYVQHFNGFKSKTENNGCIKLVLVFFA